ncbi:MAG: hypothetical protein AAB638_02670 [Patescibacteria group bacterium]
MVQSGINQRKNLAMSLRRGGYSYSEIQKFVSVPKATLSYWFRDIKLSEAQTKRLEEKQFEAIKNGGATRSKKVAEEIEKIEQSSIKDIQEITKRELWLMGIMLYWRERVSDRDLKHGVKFTSSDPYLIKLFIKWLKEVGQLEDSEITFDIFMPLNRRKDLTRAVEYWAGISGYSQKVFQHAYFQKEKPTKKTKKKVEKRKVSRAEFGLLRIRVKASSMLARQMVGWIKAIQSKI